MKSTGNRPRYLIQPSPHSDRKYEKAFLVEALHFYNQCKGAKRRIVEKEIIEISIKNRKTSAKTDISLANAQNKHYMDSSL